jgi:single-strand DNA-binding protein
MINYIPTTQDSESGDENQVRITGIISKDPLVGTTPSGHARAFLEVVTLRRFTSQGKSLESRERHYIVAWDRAVDAVRKLEAGQRVSVFGYLQTHCWDADGIRKCRTEIIAEDVIRHGPQP